MGRGFTVKDPLTTLSVAATLTKCELGTAILQLPLYEPMDLTHRVYALIRLVENGFNLGHGIVSTESDFIALNQDYPNRFIDFDTKIKALREIFDKPANPSTKLNHWRKLDGGPPISRYMGKNVKT